MKDITSLHLVSISNAGDKTCTGDNRLRLNLAGEWLYEAGFTPRAAVKLLPEPGGIAFALCSEVLLRKTGTLCRPGSSGFTAEPTPDAKKRRRDDDGFAEVRLYRNSPALCVTGKILERSHLAFGDTLLALYEYGYIRLRKVPSGAAKVVLSHLCGKWLIALGFTIGACFTLDAQPGLITCQLQENAVARTLELVKFARKNKLKLLQVENIKRVPHIFVPPSCLDKAEFTQNDALLAAYDYGHISLRKLDFRALGF